MVFEIGSSVSQWLPGLYLKILTVFVTSGLIIHTHNSLLQTHTYTYAHTRPYNQTHARIEPHTTAYDLMSGLFTSYGSTISSRT